MAGTGGTISSSGVSADEYTLRARGVGNREDDGLRAPRAVPLPARNDWKLELRDRLDVEVKYCALESGVSLAELGVRLSFLGIMEGDRAVLLKSGIGSSIGMAGKAITGGVSGGARDMRLRRLASVGLMVLAPSPLILPDWRLLPPDAGVVALRCCFPAAGRLDDRARLAEDPGVATSCACVRAGCAAAFAFELCVGAVALLCSIGVVALG